MTEEEAATAKWWSSKKARITIASIAVGVLVVGATGAAFAINSSQQTAIEAAAPEKKPTPTKSPAPTKSSTATPTPTAKPTEKPTEKPPAADSGSSGGSGSSSGGSGSSGGGSAPAPAPAPAPPAPAPAPAPAPPPPPPPPAYTSAQARNAVANAYGAQPVWGNCAAANYGTWSAGSTPPPPVYVGILGYEAGALGDGSGGWVNYYSCE